MDRCDTSDRRTTAPEIFPGDEWRAQPEIVKGLLVAINVPGYYSLPVRVLTLRARNHPGIARKFDIRYAEWDNPQYTCAGAGGIERLARQIAVWGPRVLGFSVNIWNRETCFQVAERIKDRDPETCILAGGQEVTGSLVDYLADVPALDYLVDGEGEHAFIDFLQAFDPRLNRLSRPESVPGLRYRSGRTTAGDLPARVLATLDDNPSVIMADLVPVNAKDKLGVLLESSRGCPFRCGFCFEGAKHEKIRTAGIERLAREAEHMAAKGSRYFHVMDPILCNHDIERLARLDRHFSDLQARYGRLSISVETYADQISKDVARHLKAFTMLDIGLQSTHPETLRAIHRRLDTKKFVAGVERIQHGGATTNIYLILGLPFETAESFLTGLRFAIDCRPTQIFLNELLLLNGTDLRRRAEEFGYDFDPLPPYTVFANRWLSRPELDLLKTYAKNVEHRYNLNHCSAADIAPWKPRTHTFEPKWLRMPLNGRCSQRCTGCRFTTGSDPAAGDLRQMLERAGSANIELVGGDGIDLQTVVQTAAQFQLAGAARIRLAAPPALFGRPQAVESSVLGGIHFFRTYLDGDDEEGKWKRQLGGFAAIRTTGVVFSGRKIHPHLEIAMQTAFESPAEQLAAACELGRNCASLVALTPKPGRRPGKRGPRFARAAAPAIGDAVEHRFALKLPPAEVRSMVGGPGNADRILDSLRWLGLVADDARRPCYWPLRRKLSDA